MFCVVVLYEIKQVILSSEMLAAVNIPSRFFFLIAYQDVVTVTSPLPCDGDVKLAGK